MKLFDTHCHLDEPAFDGDRPDVLCRAREAGLVGMVAIGTTAASSRAALDLAQAESDVYAAVGIQPNYVAKEQPSDWAAITNLATDPRVVGIGETGLDCYWDYTPFDQQVEAFDRHLELSRALGKPFIVHCRESEEDVVAQLRRHASVSPLNGIMHSFCGDQTTLEACLELGLMISFAGMVTFKRNDELRAVAREVPLDRLLIETDAPYLAPIPYRGKRNEPSFVAGTATVLAEVHGMTAEDLAQQTTENARRIFQIPES